jgi:hypothetical protein
MSKTTLVIPMIIAFFINQTTLFSGSKYNLSRIMAMIRKIVGNVIKIFKKYNIKTIKLTVFECYVRQESKKSRS